MHTSRLCLAALLAACACSSEPAKHAHDDHDDHGHAPAAAAPAAPVVTASGAQRFGAELSAQPAVALADVLKAPDSYADKTVTVEGFVRKTCQNKGCWMEVAPTADAATQGCRVTFKDYGFFVPMDSTGSTARIEGVLQIATVSKADVDHLEAEGAKFAMKAADGTAREVKIVASGVELSKPPKG